MPRRAAATVRPIEADPMYGSKLVQQVINKVMVDGKKSTAEGIVYEALETLSKRPTTSRCRRSRSRLRSSRLRSRCAPPRRRRDLPGARRGAPPAPARSPCAGSWSSPASAARSRWRNASPESSATPSPSRAPPCKRKDDIFRMAQANKAFAHYRW